MKRLLFSSVFGFLCFFVTSQNLQLHYDFGSVSYPSLRSRPQLTATFEMFRPDAWGSTFFFVDMDLNAQGVKSGYAELARELRFWKFPVSLHVEYNGGLNSSMSFMNAYLGGVTYTYDKEDYSGGFAFSTLYKYLQNEAQPHSFQLTLTWYYNFYHDLFSISGFADFWREQRVWQHTNYIFMAEPQFWFNLNALKGVNDAFKLSIGTEVEVSENFVSQGFYAIPTIALKWSFQ